MDKYTTIDLQLLNPTLEKDKIIISNDSFAICDLISLLINKLEHLRISFLK